jgi:hypothetical protein
VAQKQASDFASIHKNARIMNRENVPVLFLVFNRPETTARVWQRICEARPPRLYIACDGPRDGREGEQERIDEVRRITETDINWPCTVQRRYRDRNLGCRQAVSDGINWFFEHEELGIILEDDCLPSVDFFRFCAELLKLYRDDQRIFMISGNNFQHGRRQTPYSYYYSWYTHIWGWATWRRSWAKVDLEMKSYPDFIRSGGARKIVKHVDEARRWEKTFERYLKGRYNTWDYPLMFASWWHKQVTILPEMNLVTNIGAGAGIDQTHSFDPSVDALFHIPTQPLGEIHHNPDVQVAYEADYHTFSHHIYPSWQKKFRARVRKWWHSVFAR